MVVRQRDDSFVLIKQHDHGNLAGKFASYLDHIIEPLSATLYAISNHDIGWEKLDYEVRWSEEKNRPYSFLDYPLSLKLEAYKEGISIVERYSPYAGYLCSKHFSSFFRNVTEPMGKLFFEHELERQRVQYAKLSEVEKENIDINVCLLQFCDDLSLSLCLNEPTENNHPWYIDGLSYFDKLYRWVWEDKETLRLEPNIFAKSFEVAIPYQIVDKERHVCGEGFFCYKVKAL